LIIKKPFITLFKLVITPIGVIFTIGGLFMFLFFPNLEELANKNIINITLDFKYFLLFLFVFVVALSFIIICLLHNINARFVKIDIYEDLKINNDERIQKIEKLSENIKQLKKVNQIIEFTNENTLKLINAIYLKFVDKKTKNDIIEMIEKQLKNGS
jgi:hypothetical protein